MISHSTMLSMLLPFLGADSAAMAEQQQWFASKPEVENFGLALASDTEAYAGHLAQSAGTDQAGCGLRYTGRQQGKLAPSVKANAAQREAAFGNSAEARQSAAEALKLAPASQGVESEAALAFAMAGETARADSLAQDLGKRFPLDTQMQSLWLPAIRAQLALDRKNPAAALNTLQAASTARVGQIAFVNNISCLYPTYVRGEAYLAAGQGDAAAAEFQKILDHSGIVWNCWTGALAHLGVARAECLAGENLAGSGCRCRPRPRTRRLQRFPHALERRRPRHPHPETSQGRVRKAKVIACSKLALANRHRRCQLHDRTHA